MKYVRSNWQISVETSARIVSISRPQFIAMLPAVTPAFDFSPARAARFRGRAAGRLNCD